MPCSVTNTQTIPAGSLVRLLVSSSAWTDTAQKQRYRSCSFFHPIPTQNQANCSHTCVLPKVSEHWIQLSPTVKQLCKFCLVNSPIEVGAVLYILQAAHALKYLAESMLPFAILQK